MSDPQKVTYIGKVDFRNQEIPFGIKAKDRTRHTYVIGKTGMGKSTLLENFAVQDIQNGEGLCVIDPHGSMAERLLDFIPESRVKDVVYFAPFDTEYPMALNVLEKVDQEKRHLVANGLMAAFKKVFGEDKFSDRIQYILMNIILALLENEGETLLGVNRMLSDKEYRKKMVANVSDPSVKTFWQDEFVKAGDKYQQEAAPGVQNKIGQFISNPLIRNIVGQVKTSFDVREIMDNKKILIINLSKGKVGEGNANLLGSLLITKIYLAAMSRADAGPYALEALPPFYLYVDEFQNFANDSFASILSEARKYKLALTVAHQYIEQMVDEVKAAVFGNVGTMITFRVGATDAEVFEREFAPFFMADDIVNLSAYQVYLRLMIDGVGSKPFSASTLPPIAPTEASHAQQVIAYSREHFARNREQVEKVIQAWYEPVIKEEMRAPGIERKNTTSYTTPYTPPVATHQQSHSSDSSVRHDAPRHDTRHDTRNVRDSQYKAPSQERRQSERRDERERPPRDEQRKPSKSDLFDDKPATSLGEALRKALAGTDNAKEEVKAAPPTQTAQKAKEVDEATLKKLLNDDVTP
jgi:hypothetical protein